MSPLAAAALAACDVKFVVIGGCALVLHGVAGDCVDLDIVPACGSQNLRRLSAVLDALGARPCADARSMTTDVFTTVRSPYGRIDMLVGSETADYDQLEWSAVTVTVAEVEVRVAAVDDVRRLRSRYGVSNRAE